MFRNLLKNLENEALATLVYGDTPLIKFQADEAYFCPTCEKLVASGYGLNMSDQKVISELREVLNHKFISLEKKLLSQSQLKNTAAGRKEIFGLCISE